MTSLIIVVLVVVILALLVWFGSRESGKQKYAWAAGVRPAGLDWTVLLSSEVQACLPDNKIEAIRLYREATGVGLKEAKDAVEYAMAYPERAPSHLMRSDASEPRKMKSKEAGIDWDVLLSGPMQALLPDKKIDAIKFYREATGAGLKEAKDAIEEYLLNPEAVPAKIRRYDLVATQSEGIRDLLREGKREEARKTYQAFTGVDQFTANEAIDALEAEVRMEDEHNHASSANDMYDEGSQARPS